MFTKNTMNRGFIRTVILIVIALLVLSYFGFNIRDTVESPTAQSNFGYVKMVILDIWNDYLKKPALYLWNDIFIKLIWNTAIENLDRLKTGEQSTINELAPLAAPGSATSTQ